MTCDALAGVNCVVCSSMYVPYGRGAGQLPGSCMARTVARPRMSLPAETMALHEELGRVEESNPQRSESAGRQSGDGVGHPAEFADRRELAALAHSPAEQLLRVGVD